MRSLELCFEADIEGREAETNAWERVWDAIFACAVCDFLLSKLDFLLAFQTCTEKTHAFAYTAEYGCTSWAIRVGAGECGVGCVE
jgi:hypothetical protein